METRQNWIFCFKHVHKHSVIACFIFWVLSLVLIHENSIVRNGFNLHSLFELDPSQHHSMHLYNFKCVGDFNEVMHLCPWWDSTFNDGIRIEIERRVEINEKSFWSHSKSLPAFQKCQWDDESVTCHWVPNVLGAFDGLHVVAGTAFAEFIGSRICWMADMPWHICHDRQPTRFFATLGNQDR